MTTEALYLLTQQISQHVGSEAIVKIEASKQNPQEVVIVTTPAFIKQICQFLKNQKKFMWMMDICGVHYPEREQNLEVVYHLFNRDQNQRVRIKVPHREGEKIPSITSVYRAANWFEREAFDMMGILFQGHPNLTRILTHHKFVGHPLRKDYHARDNQVLDTPMPMSFEGGPTPLGEDDDILTNQRTLINIGPSHPFTHGTFRIFCELEGETIMRAKTEIGYLHRCFEKMCETHKYQQVIPYTDRLNYLSAPMNNAGYCRAIEKLFGVEIPDRAQIIRVVLNELSRVIDHLVCIGTTAVDMGALTTFWFCFKQRENVYTLFEKLCGNRILTSITRIGGMAGDIDDDWIVACRATVKELYLAIDEVDRLLSNNKIWIDRLRDTGVVKQEDAIDYGFTGPALRSTGVDLDLRKQEPYYHYNEFDFEVPTTKEGDNFSRFQIRMLEMVQSLRIVEQALDKLPEGPVQIQNPLITLPPKKEVYTNIEALMNHFMLVLEGMKPPKGDVYSYTEAANGELGFYVVSDGSGYPYRIKVRPPCFAVYSAFESIIQGGLLADAVATLGQFNVIAGEIDR